MYRYFFLHALYVLFVRSLFMSSMTAHLDTIISIEKTCSKHVRISACSSVQRFCILQKFFFVILNVKTLSTSSICGFEGKFVSDMVVEPQRQVLLRQSLYLYCCVLN